MGTSAWKLDWDTLFKCEKKMASRLVIILQLLSLFSTFTFSKNLLVEVEDDGAAGEDEGAAFEPEIDVDEPPPPPPPEVDGEDYAPPAGPPPISPDAENERHH